MLRGGACAAQMTVVLQPWHALPQLVLVSLLTAPPFQLVSNTLSVCVNRQHLCPCELSDWLFSTIHATFTVRPSEDPWPPMRGRLFNYWSHATATAPSAIATFELPSWCFSAARPLSVEGGGPDAALLLLHICPSFSSHALAALAPTAQFYSGGCLKRPFSGSLCEFSL